MNDYFSKNLTIYLPVPQKTYQVIEFKGEMDKAGLYEVKGQVEAFIEKFKLDQLIFDLTALNFINSESIGFLMSIHSHLAKLDKKLILVSAKPNIKDIFQVIGLFNVIDYYDSLASFTEKTGQ